MRRLALALVPTLLAVGTAAQTATVAVLGVVDGDTVDVQFEYGTVERLRLIGLDTPEVVDPRQSVQCYGREASARHSLRLGLILVSAPADTSRS